MVTKMSTLNCNVPETPPHKVWTCCFRGMSICLQRGCSQLFAPVSIRPSLNLSQRREAGSLPVSHQDSNRAYPNWTLVTRPGGEAGPGEAVCPIIPPFCAVGASPPCPHADSEVTLCAFLPWVTTPAS